MNAANDPQFKLKGPSLAALILVPLTVGILTFIAVAKLLWHDAPQIFMPLPGIPFKDHLTRWLSGMLVLLSGGSVGTGLWQTYVKWLAHLEPALRWALYARLILAALVGAGSAVFTLRWLLGNSGIDKPLRGRPLRRGPKAVKQLAAEATREWKGVKHVTEGIHLHPEVTISQERETKHLLIMGASGSGKTNIIWHVLKEAILRKDRIVIFDSKGDFTSELSSLCLLAPWDPRSLAWDVARDCAGPLDAQALSAHLIPDSDKDPIWPNASRAVLVAMIIHLQTSKPGQWTFPDLRALLHLPIEDMRLIAQQHNPEALRSLEEGSKTTQSILINLMAFMAPVVDMARAWSDPAQKRFSMKDWIEGNSKLSRTVVMQGSQRFDRTAAALVNSLLSVMAATIASPSLPDDKNRRIWLVLDEFAQLGQLRDFGPLIRMGRSKGLRIVIGAQDIAELRAIYGTHKTDAWASSLTTSIYTRLEGGATSEWVSRRIGEQETLVNQNSQTQGGNGTSETQQTTIRKSPTVLPAELKTLIGARSVGVDALLDGFDDAVYLVTYPYHVPKPIRAGTRYAAWVQPTLPPLTAPIPSSSQATAQAVASPPQTDIDPPASDGDPDDQATARAAGSAPRAKRWAKRPPTPGTGNAGSTR
jgi:hypothetical protein